MQGIKVEASEVAAFELGQYVTTSEGLTGFIFGEEGGTFLIATCEREEERVVSGDDILPWVARSGETEPIWS